MKKTTNRNLKTEFDYQYVEQQRALKELCREYDLVYYLPDYHANKNDCNTVLVYTKEAHEYNERNCDYNHSLWRQKNEKDYVLSFDNTDVNGYFDLNFMNRGKIDFRGKDVKTVLSNIFQKVC